MFYRLIIRPILFLFDPEFIHHFTFTCFRLFPGMGSLLKRILGIRKRIPDQPFELMGLPFRHEVGLAGGLDKDAVALKFFKNMGFAFMEIGTVTPLPQKGNPRPRLFRLKRNQALINRMGFNNDGLEAIRNRLKNRPKGFIVGGNIGKNTLTSNEDAWRDYLTCFEGLYDYVDFFIVNVSCPNIKDLSQLQNRDQLSEILTCLLEHRKGKSVIKPVLLKISPDLSEKQIDEVIEVVLETGIEGLVATNTSIRREGLDYSPDHLSAIGSGGLSGRPLSVVSTRMIRYLHDRLGGQFPIIGSGGVMDENDALEKMQAGASLVQIYTGFIYEGPSLLGRILRKLHQKAGSV